MSRRVNNDRARKQIARGTVTVAALRLADPKPNPDIPRRVYAMSLPRLMHYKNGRALARNLVAFLVFPPTSSPRVSCPGCSPLRRACWSVVRALTWVWDTILFACPATAQRTDDGTTRTRQ
ncbi:uncharacterized protein B0H18DRAFT_1011251 [Fomitopsis serialis]|uniref:uncharacterized protein n=1 Tax=Fomitopsis serialis TaxID=139415 RepID=UPI002007629E|nr:uncharacterized protein B0H18DRAFT_1011251 [Neoantrodia serialis]KAH9924793.1 hypothetical protein B0H18DRAFT_1011251 [Neoantrodia serialis]